jgi:hypothetical protein
MLQNRRAIVAKQFCYYSIDQGFFVQCKIHKNNCEQHHHRARSAPQITCGATPPPAVEDGSLATAVSAGGVPAMKGEPKLDEAAGSARGWTRAGGVDRPP